eukprot:CAMPEP_0115845746 /NCGR_PEP_ID=MMETSP0287-20121206/9513_1 /TAXON_ID=412157 /ORGANISM="Chrysochromulina rotalis, Strain UIO044" /LENGTH=251 /DNA_ID=CAMNT_0003299533 /DNA_START=402 /DNA_END=1157 /DNA_ORIENTATION=-
MSLRKHLFAIDNHKLDRLALLLEDEPHGVLGRGGHLVVDRENSVAELELGCRGGAALVDLGDQDAYAARRRLQPQPDRHAYLRVSAREQLSHHDRPRAARARQFHVDDALALADVLREVLNGVDNVVLNREDHIADLHAHRLRRLARLDGPHHNSRRAERVVAYGHAEATRLLRQLDGTRADVKALDRRFLPDGGLLLDRPPVDLELVLVASQHARLRVDGDGALVPALGTNHEGVCAARIGDGFPERLLA